MLMTSTAKLMHSHQDIDANIIYMARVSSTHQTKEDHVRLIKYLIKHGHWSPFDLMNIVLEINTQKDIAIQLLRHQTLKPQEFSQRYAECTDMLPQDVYRECRLQHPTNRQLSLDNTTDTDLNHWWETTQQEVYELIRNRYTQALDKGIAKEVARCILPMATQTKMYFNASIRSWLFYCKARLDETSQKEHRQLAKQVLDILYQVAPATTQAFVEHFNLEYTQ